MHIETRCENEIESLVTELIMYFQAAENLSNFKSCIKAKKRKEDLFTNEFVNKDHSVNERIMGWKKLKELKPRLHLNTECPKKRGTGAKPDCFFDKDGNIECFIEIKMLSNNNDCDIFNGIVQLREYMDIYQVSKGILLVISSLEKYYRPAAEFLASLECENIKVVVANYHNDNWMVKPISEVMRDDDGFLKGDRDDN